MSSSESDFEEEVEVKKKETKKRAKKSADEEEPVEKKAKKEVEVKEKRPLDDRGNELFEFGNLRFASVSEFKGKQYLNIREYYMDKNSGKMMPGKKGISLTKAQWQNLKDIIPQLDKKF